MDAVRNVLNKISGFLWPFLFVILTCTFIKLSFSKTQIYFFVNTRHSPFGDILFPRLTFFGSLTFAVCMTLLLALFVSYRNAFLLGTSYLFTAAINFPLKYFFYAPRPSLYFKGLHKEIYFVPGIEVLENNYSFPSGHTVCVFTAAVVFSYIAPKKGLGISYLIIALLVGYSRMYMSEHFFEDVFAGSIVGTGLTIIWLAVTQNLAFLKRKKWSSSLLGHH